MTDPRRNDDNIDRFILKDAMNEAKDMGRKGMQHPSTAPVLTGAAIGAVAGAVLPVISWPVGLLAGAGYMLYKRVRP
ncbi:hypothetical protein [Aurantiacibacter gilvus]|uniref:Secreted protein with PEP-CTERM sorting signal n=1 Tax=Aurantiacibacter gilvus TaxID=3139141 RepID=A0ABU9ID76_9SPHN